MAPLALGFLVLAALGGATINQKFHAHQPRLPFAVMAGFALLAASGVALLLLSSCRLLG